MQKTFKIVITGRVQGVGFRPHVFQMAKDFGLSGTVSNNEEGVIIYTTASPEVAGEFYKTLVSRPSKASRITGHFFDEVAYRKFDDFRIIPSEKGRKLNLQLTPDFAICKLCSEDMVTLENRRYSYPFTTCVHCGPRWAITSTFPFERENTSISSFEMCDPCLKEYTNPEDRRFHSQTNSCPDCGINYRLTDSQGNAFNIPGPEVFSTIVSLLREANIIAIKNTGGYLLCCDATSAEVVRTLRNKKNRPEKPFAIMYPSLEMLKRQFAISEQQEALLCSPERPIVIISSVKNKSTLAETDIAPGLNQLGVMLPYTGIMQLLANQLDFPIVATSGNLHGSPIISDENESIEILDGVADYFFHHNLKITNPQDDSVVKISRNEQQVMFRRARGYAPNFYRSVDSRSERILALGGNLKSTIAFIPNEFVYISEYLGMLDQADVFNRFTNTVSKFIGIFEADPEVVLTDKHPGYQSTRYGIKLAEKSDIRHFQIQHHMAHFASVLGEHDLMKASQGILGVIWDGTGYGNDGQIWGGEFFSYQDNQIERIAHFEYFNWLAGDKMAKEPRLSLLSLLDAEELSEIEYKFSDEEITVYRSLKETNKLKTSSVGRLFDAVASLLDICDLNTYEGEAAIRLENYISGYDLGKCRNYVEKIGNDSIPTEIIWKGLFSDFKAGTSKEQLIANFLYTLACLVRQVAARHGFKEIAFSGGVFQNTILTDMIIDIVGADFKLYFHRELAPNDENISFGQLMYYLHCIKPLKS